MFFFELDTATERIATKQKLPSSIQKKLEFYERYRQKFGNCFRVLFVTTSSKQRAENILAFSQAMTNNIAASMVYAAFVADLRKHDDWLTQPVFQNHHLQRVPLIPSRLDHSDGGYLLPE